MLSKTNQRKIYSKLNNIYQSHCDKKGVNFFFSELHFTKTLLVFFVAILLVDVTTFHLIETKKHSLTELLSSNLSVYLPLFIIGIWSLKNRVSEIDPRYLLFFAPLFLPLIYQWSTSGNMLWTSRRLVTFIYPAVIFFSLLGAKYLVEIKFKEYRAVGVVLALVVIAYQTAGWMKYNASLVTASSEIEANFLKQSQYGLMDILNRQIQKILYDRENQQTFSVVVLIYS